MEPRVYQRASGCLYGQAVGDALGTRYEFSSAEKTASTMAEDKGAAEILPILGGGPFHLEKGQVTDDTEMVMALARSLIRKSTYDPCDVAAAYVDWCESNPVDIGSTTKWALEISPDCKGDSRAVLENVLSNARSRCKDSLSNGCLMRISPLSIAGVDWSESALNAAAMLNCRLTNPHDVAQSAVVCFVNALTCLIRTGDAKTAYAKALELATNPVVKGHLLFAKKSPTPVTLQNGKTTIPGDKDFMGYLGVALQFSFYHLLHAHSFAEGLEAVIRLGGDTDTNGCIAGALLGAKFGADLIPGPWKDAVKNANAPRHKAYPTAILKDIEDVVSRLLRCTEPVALASLK